MNKSIGASRRTLKDHDEQRLLRDRPPHFYKYKSIDDDNLKHSSCIFTDNELYFCTANDFNDPFDCEFQVEFSGSKIEAADTAPTYKKNTALRLVEKIAVWQSAKT